MNTLTNQQAQKLRELRRMSNQAAHQMELLTSGLAAIQCEGHEYEPETCPVCALYSIATDVEPKLGKFCIDMDRYLLDGPVPTATEVKRG